MDTSQVGTARATRLKTRSAAKAQSQKQSERDFATEGLSQADWWKAKVNSEADIVRFYQLYYPQYSEPLVLSIAQRVSGIIEKSRRGEVLTQEEVGYWSRSQVDSATTWDPTEDLKAQQFQGQMMKAMTNMDKLLSE